MMIKFFSPDNTKYLFYIVPGLAVFALFILLLGAMSSGGSQGLLCRVSIEWDRFTPIQITRELSYYPSAPAALACMIPGSRIGFSILAEDYDYLLQRCENECSGSKGVKAISRIADRVRIRWELNGPGRLLHNEGPAILYQLPGTAGQAIATLTYRIDNAAGKAPDETIQGQVEIRITQNSETNCLGVSIHPADPSKPSYQGSELQDAIAPDCQPKREVWLAAKAIQGNMVIPDKICPKAIIPLEADYSDLDNVRLECVAKDCGNDRKDFSADDPVIYTWSDGGAGGSFPMGNSGSRVMYIAPDKPKKIAFELTVRDSGTQHTDTQSQTNQGNESTMLFDLTAVNVGSMPRWRNITVGHSYKFTPKWTPRKLRVKKIKWETDLGGKTGSIEKILCSTRGMDPKQAALVFKTSKKEQDLQVSWRLHSHVHEQKTLSMTAYADVTGDGCICEDSEWDTSDFLTGQDHNEYLLFFDKTGNKDDGRVEDINTVNSEDSWGDTTSLHGVGAIENWFLHWSSKTYAASSFDHAQTKPKLRYYNDSPSWFGYYDSSRLEIVLSDNAAGSAKRKAFSGKRWIRTSNDKWLNTRKIGQRSYKLVGHQLATKVYLHEMGHYASMTEMWAKVPRTLDDVLVKDGSIQLPASNRIRTTIQATGNYNGKEENGVDAHQKYNITVSLQAKEPPDNKITHTFTLNNAWIEQGKVQGQQIQFVIANVAERWRFRGVTFERFHRANDPDKDHVPNQVEDMIGTLWNEKGTHPHHARGKTKTSSGVDQAPDQEYFADHVVIGLNTPGFGLDNAKWQSIVNPGPRAKDWANPGAQSDPPDK